jgi:hypothetical protein
MRFYSPGKLYNFINWIMIIIEKQEIAKIDSKIGI